MPLVDRSATAPPPGRRNRRRRRRRALDPGRPRPFAWLRDGLNLRTAFISIRLAVREGTIPCERRDDLLFELHRLLSCDTLSARGTLGLVRVYLEMSRYDLRLQRALVRAEAARHAAPRRGRP